MHYVRCFVGTPHFQDRIHPRFEVCPLFPPSRSVLVDFVKIYERPLTLQTESHLLLRWHSSPQDELPVNVCFDKRSVFLFCPRCFLHICLLVSLDCGRIPEIVARFEQMRIRIYFPFRIFSSTTTTVSFFEPPCATSIISTILYPRALPNPLLFQPNDITCPPTFTLSASALFTFS